MRRALLLLGLGSFSLGAVLASCGGSTSNLSSGGDAGDDVTSAPTKDAQAEDASDGAAPTSSDAGDAGDAGLPPCAAPSDPGKSAACVVLEPEAITFIASDPTLDGKGLLIVQAFDTATPDLADGGTAAALATAVLGGPDAGANGAFDLSMPSQVIRLDGLPPTVYLRAVFADDPTLSKGLKAGDWLGGYDLTAGLYQGVPLRGESLTLGQGTTIALPLRALRKMTVTLSLATTPAGNAQGPAEVLAVDTTTLGNGARLFGTGQSACASASDGGTADVVGFVLGKGPYYVTGWIDDFGSYEGGALLTPGTLAALQVDADGGVQIPTANQLAYGAQAYAVTKSIALGLLIPGDAGVDTVTCP